MPGQPYITTQSGRRIRLGDKKNGMLLRKHAPLYMVTFVSQCEWASPSVPFIWVAEGESVTVPLVITMGANYSYVGAIGGTVSEAGVTVANVTGNMVVKLVPAREPYVITIESLCDWASTDISSVSAFEGNSITIPIMLSDDADFSTILVSGAPLVNGSIALDNIQSDIAVTINPRKVQIVTDFTNTDRVLAIAPSIMYVMPGDTAEFTITYADGYDASSVDANDAIFEDDKLIVSASETNFVMTINITNHVNWEIIDATIQIGNINSGTTSYLPTYTYYNYSLTQQILYPSDIKYEGTPRNGTITSISFYVSRQTTDVRMRNIDVYMLHTTKAEFSTDANSWVSLSNAHKVYSGYLVTSSTGWVTITLNNPFEYNGIDNLLIATNDTTGSYWSSGTFAASTGTMRRSIYAYRDSSNYNIENPGVSSYTSDMYKTNCMRLGMTIKIPISGEPGGGEPIYPESTVVPVSIGNEGSTGLGIFPTNASSSYTLTQQIYLASDLHFTGSVQSVSFYVSRASSSDCRRNIDIYLAYTDITSYDDATSSSLIPMSQQNKVGTGILDLSSVGWATIQLSTPFNYDGAHNVLLTVNDTTGVPKSEYRCSTITTPGLAKRSIYWSNYSASNGPFNPGTPQSVSPTTSNGYNAINALRLEVIPSGVEKGSGEILINSGNGSLLTSYPLGMSTYKYCYAKTLFYATEIGAYGIIAKIGFYNSYGTTTRRIDILMKHSDKTYLRSSSNVYDWDPITPDYRVFSGEVTFTQNEWTLVTLDTPFIYNGMQNLIVAVDDNTGVAGSFIVCNAFTRANSGEPAIAHYSNIADISPLSPAPGQETSNDDSATYNHRVPIIQLIFA